MAEEGSGAAGAASEGTQTGSGEGGQQGSQQGSGESTTKTAEEYRKELRTYERSAKAASERKDAEVAELKSKLEQHEAASQTETEKAIGKAKKDAVAEAQSGFEKERKADRLQLAVAKRAREIADVDDMVARLQRSGIEDAYDKDGKIKVDAFNERFDAELAEAPHMKAGPHGRPAGSANGGEGEGGDAPTMNDLLRAGR